METIAAAPGVAAIEAASAGTGVVDRDCPCVGCGYNVRTRSIDDRCPECRTGVRQTLAAHAARLAGADRRWLRGMTNGALWLLLAMVAPAVFAWLWWPDGATVTSWRLGVMVTPAVFAAAGCWRLSMKEPAVAASGAPEATGGRGGSGDQPITRWALRLLAALWFVPLCLAVRVSDLDPVPERPMISLQPIPAKPSLRPLEAVYFVLSWSGVAATVLCFRRLKRVLRRIPSRVILAQCAVIGSQLPLAFVWTTAWSSLEYEDKNPAVVYAANAPMPAVGSPWPYAIKGDKVWKAIREDFELDTSTLLADFVCLMMVLDLIVLVEVWGALMWVRWSDATLPAYCRERIEAGA